MHCLDVASSYLTAARAACLLLGNAFRCCNKCSLSLVQGGPVECELCMHVAVGAGQGGVVRWVGGLLSMVHIYDLLDVYKCSLSLV